MRLVLACVLCACLLASGHAAKLNVKGKKGRFPVAAKPESQRKAPGDAKGKGNKAARSAESGPDITSRDDKKMGQLPMVGETSMDFGPPLTAPGRAREVALLYGVDPYTGLSPTEAIVPTTLASEGFSNDTVATNIVGGGGRKLLQRRNLLQGAAGVWYFVTSDGVNPSDLGMAQIHATLMTDGRIFQIQQNGPNTLIWDPVGKVKSPTSMANDPFCGGNILSPEGRVLVFGGMNGDVNLIRDYDPATGNTFVQPMYSKRWYPTVVTFPNGAIAVVGGSANVGASGYCGATAGGGVNQMNQGGCPGDFGQLDINTYNTPTYQFYDSSTKEISVAYDDMIQQLSDCWPICSYPFVAVLPSNKVVVMAGKTTATYQISDSAWPVTLSQRLPDRPGVPWTYPQTGAAVLLPLDPATSYKAEVLSVGGNTQDFAGSETPATADAFRIDLSSASPTWVSVGPMPIPRVMANVVLLPTGDVLLVNGAAIGTAGYGAGVGVGNAKNPVLAPVLFNTKTNTWSGPLASASQARLYHAAGYLLPTGEVMCAGSEVTGDVTAEIFRPPYLIGTTQPLITVPSTPQSLDWGDNLVVEWSRKNAVAAVDRAVLVRTPSVTHSIHMDQRLVMLVTVSQSPVTSTTVGADIFRSGSITVTMPPNGAVCPPGVYMLFLISTDGVPSKSLFVSIAAELPASLPPVPVAGSGYTALPGKDYFGNDFAAFYCGGGMGCASYTDCAEYCANTAGCAAYTWTGDTCYLKKMAANLQNAGSGFVTGAIANPLAGPPPQTPIPAGTVPTPTPTPTPAPTTPPGPTASPTASPPPVATASPTPAPPGSTPTYSVEPDADFLGYFMAGASGNFPCGPGSTTCQSATDCANICQASDVCRAYVWYSNTCYLKDAVGPRGTLAGAISGVMPAVPDGTTAQGTYTVEPGTDFQGNDLSTVPCGPGVAGCTTAADCAGICFNTPGCVVYHFWRYANACQQKGAIGNKQPFQGSVSGILSRNGVPPAETPSPTPPPPPASPAPGTPPGVTYTALQNKDYAYYDLPGPAGAFGCGPGNTAGCVTYDDCAVTCANNLDCVAYTLWGGTCYNKGSVGPLNLLGGAWTGLITRA